MSGPTEEPDDDKPRGDAPRRARFWHSQLDSAKKREETWHAHAKECVSRYNDDRRGYTSASDSDRRVNILWANTEVQKGALFYQLGNPDVRRAFPKPGRANKIARTVATVLEHALTACNNRYNPEGNIRDAVENSLLPGRGTCWLEYEPTIKTRVAEEPAEAGQEYEDDREEQAEEHTPEEYVADQTATICFVDWMDFRHGPGKQWEDISWVARPHLMTEDDLEKKFPGIEDKIPMNYVLEEGLDKAKDEIGDFKRARVWEIWYKPEKIRVYVADDYQFELKRDEDPYRLENFFPCPKPLYSVKLAGTLIPRPEFLQYKDQAAELDRINTRIYRLLEKLRYCGVYDASSPDSDTLADIGRLEDGQFIAFKGYQQLAQGGGLAKAFDVRDLAPIAAAIQALSQRATELISGIYEITGISDILRGQSDPRETAAAQNIKAQSGSQRLMLKQKEVHRFVADLYRMKGELIAEHFEREMLSDMSGVLLPMQAERDQARQMLQIYAQQQQSPPQQLAAMGSAQPGFGAPPQLGAQQSPQPQQPMGSPQFQAPGGFPAPQGGPYPSAGQMQPATPPVPPGPGQPFGMPQPNGGLPQNHGLGAPLGMAQPPQIPPLSPHRLEDLQLTADACSWEEVSAVLRSDDRRNYNIKIQSDQTAFQDADAEKQRRIEYMKVMTGLMQEVIPAVQQNPSMAPFVKELVLFTSGAFETGRDLEETLEDTFDQISAAPAPKGPSEGEIKAHAELSKVQSDAAVSQMKAQTEIQKLQFSMQELQGQLQNAQADRAAKTQQGQADTQIKMTDIQLQHERALLDLQIKKENVELNKLNTLLKLKQLGLSSRAQALAEYDSMNGAADMHERRAADIQGQRQDHALAAHDVAQTHAIAHRKIDAQQQSDAADLALRQQQAAQQPQPSIGGAA